jgi:nucleotide-binding universal stress UspA family protein
MPVMELKKDTAEIKESTAAISIKNVLYATDFSATSESALPYAAAVCRRFGSRLHLAHVLSDTSILLMTGGVDYVSFETLYNDAEMMAREKLNQVADKVGKLECRTYVRQGQVWPMLSDVVLANHIDLILVGTHGRTGLGKLLLGSVAEDILRHAPCPVLTVGPAVDGVSKLPGAFVNPKVLAPLALEVRQILCAANTNVAPACDAAVAISLAKEFQSRLTLLHVIEGDSRLGAIPKENDAVVRTLKEAASAAKLAYAPEVLTEFGSAWRCIVKKAAELNADLLVLGARSDEASTHLPWSTVHQVLAHASCQVLTVRG